MWGIAFVSKRMRGRCERLYLPVQLDRLLLDGGQAAGASEGRIKGESGGK